MSQKVNVLLVDDVDGSEASETLTIGYNGRTYELDLSAANAMALRADVEKWTQHGRSINGARVTRATGATTRRDRLQSEAIRQWAASQGLHVAPRGRIPRKVEDAYAEAHAVQPAGVVDKPARRSRKR